MDHVYASNASGLPTSPPFPGAYGFTQINNAAWTPGATTVLGPFIFYYVAESIRNVIVAAGLTPDPTNLKQFYQAVEILAAGGL
jgi:hypothetical protein